MINNTVFISIISVIIFLIILYIFYNLFFKNNILDHSSEKYFLSDKCKCYIDPESNIIKVINIYASDCSYSRNFSPIWEKLKKRYSQGNLGKNIRIELEEYDEKTDKEIINQFNITGYPTILIVKRNKIYEYPPNGPLTIKSINKWIRSFI